MRTNQAAYGSCPISRASDGWPEEINLHPDVPRWHDGKRPVHRLLCHFQAVVQISFKSLLFGVQPNMEFAFEAEA